MITKTLQKLVAVSAVAFIFAPLSAQAVDYTCSVPDANVSKVSALCEGIRRSIRVRLSEWSDDVCAGYVFRLGLIDQEERRAKREVKSTSRTTVRDAVNEFTETWPKPAPVVCGDGIVDREFDEECDDGNTVSGDGCDITCITER